MAKRTLKPKGTTPVAQIDVLSNDRKTTTPVSPANPLPVSPTTVDSIGDPMPPPENYTQTLTRNADGTVSLRSFTDGVNTYEKSYTYSSSLLTGESPWILNYYARAHQTQNAGHAWSYDYDSFTGIYRFEVRAGDVWVNDPAYAERSEITALEPEAFGHDITVRYSVMVEPGAPNMSARVVMGQFHETPDVGDLGITPCFALELYYERMRGWVRFTAVNPTVVLPPDIPLFMDATDIVRGRWYAMQIDIRFDPFGNGRCVVKRDGAQLASYTGALGSNDALGPYWKMGIYRASTAETIAIQYTNPHITRR